jgi:hypothetical protein
MAQDSRACKVVLDGTDITEHVEGPVTFTVSPDSPMKDRALFYLDRRLRVLEEKRANMEAMASSGMSYAERRRVVAQQEQQNLDNQHEREALQWLRDRIQEKL